MCIPDFENSRTGYRDPNTPTRIEASRSLADGSRARCTGSTHAKNRNNVHVEFSFEPLVHGFTDLLNLIFDREHVIADLELGIGLGPVVVLIFVLLRKVQYATSSLSRLTISGSSNWVDWRADIASLTRHCWTPFTRLYIRTR